MNILYIDHYAGSPVLGMEFRAFYLARQWVKQGHRVRIVAASHAHTRQRQPRVREAVERQGFDRIEYIFLRTPKHEGNGWGRVLNIFAFVARLYWHLKDITRDFAPDLVIASSAYPFDMGPAKRIARRHHARLVYEVSELWPDSPAELWGWDSGHPFLRLCAWAQRRAVRAADAVVSVLPKAEAYLREYGLAPGKFHHVPNGIDPDEWGDEEGEGAGIDTLVQAVIDRFRAQGRMVVGYAGSLGETNAMEVLIEAAGFVRDLPVAFICIGDGPYRAPLQDYAEQLNVADRFVLAGALPKRQVPRFLRQMDVLYMGARALGVYRHGVSFNKIYDYMMAGRPIVMAVEAGNDMLAEADGGITVPSGDPRDVAAALEKLLAMPQGERNGYGVDGRTHVLLEHAYPVLARRFLEAVAKR